MFPPREQKYLCPWAVHPVQYSACWLAELNDAERSTLKSTAISLFSGGYCKNEKSRYCYIRLFGWSASCFGVQLWPTANCAQHKKGGEKGNNEALKAVLRAHSLAHLCAVDGSATKGDTSLWFIAAEISWNTGLPSPRNKQHIRREIEPSKQRPLSTIIYKEKCNTVKLDQGQRVVLKKVQPSHKECSSSH